MNETREEKVVTEILKCCVRLVKGADDKNYYNNRCTVELDDVEEIEEWLKELE